MSRFFIMVLAMILSFCGSGDSEFRKSKEGENCTKTDDCEEPLVCKYSLCKMPELFDALDASKEISFYEEAGEQSGDVFDVAEFSWDAPDVWDSGGEEVWENPFDVNIVELYYELGGGDIPPKDSYELADLFGFCLEDSEVVGK
ncbi:MAG: hypothetical protein FJ088_03960 [Deltaproteobacteria bacterium]|nr:hypothetical protein [Deltaproteobacteria bacterium]